MEHPYQDLLDREAEFDQRRTCKKYEWTKRGLLAIQAICDCGAILYSTRGPITGNDTNLAAEAYDTHTWTAELAGQARNGVLTPAEQFADIG